MPSWRDALLKNRDKFTLHFTGTYNVIRTYTIHNRHKWVKIKIKRE